MLAEPSGGGRHTQPQCSARREHGYVEGVSEWDEHAAGWDDNEAVRAYADAAHASLVSAVAAAGIELAGANVCDFGCGTGLLTERLVAAGCRHVDAVDTSSAMRAVLAAKIERHGWQQVAPRHRRPP